MKISTNWIDRFDQLDLLINQWLVDHSNLLLRIGTGVVFLEFGTMKFFYGSSPVENLATYMLTGGLLSGNSATAIVAILECITGICLLSSRSLQVGIWLLSIQLVSALVPFVFFSNELLISLFYTPVLVAQYILTEIILVAVGIFVAINWSSVKPASKSESLWV